MSSNVEKDFLFSRMLHATHIVCYSVEHFLGTGPSALALGLDVQTLAVPMRNPCY